MKDIHCHILFGIDDGSEDIKESIKIIEKAVENGYTDLILTPHYRYDQNFIADNKTKMKVFRELKKEVEKREIDVNIYLGNEITLDDDFFYYLKTNQILSLNESRYLLIELPFIRKYPNLKEVIKKIIDIGLVVIIAHPERYLKYSVDDFVELVEMGVLLQGNISSLYGKYGKQAEDKISEMLKRHMIHFLGSDVHMEMQTSYMRINDAREKIAELTGSFDLADEITSLNIDKVIRDKEIIPYPVKKKTTRVKTLREILRLN